MTVTSLVLRNLREELIISFGRSSQCTHVVRSSRDKLATERGMCSRVACVNCQGLQSKPENPPTANVTMKALPSFQDRASHRRLDDMEGHEVEESVHLPCP